MAYLYSSVCTVWAKIILYRAFTSGLPGDIYTDCTYTGYVHRIPGDIYTFYTGTGYLVIFTQTAQTQATW